MTKTEKDICHRTKIKHNLKKKKCAAFFNKLSYAEQNYNISNFWEERGSPHQANWCWYSVGLTSTILNIQHHEMWTRMLDAGLMSLSSHLYPPNFSGHPSIHQTLLLLWNCNWRPCISKEDRLFIQVCSVCAISKFTNHLPAVLHHSEVYLLLTPLPIHNHICTHSGFYHWSHCRWRLIITFDRFSKACQLVHLKSLPTAFEPKLKYVFQELWITGRSWSSIHLVNMKGLHLPQVSFNESVIPG